MFRVKFHAIFKNQILTWEKNALSLMLQKICNFVLDGTMDFMIQYHRDMLCAIFILEDMLQKLKNCYYVRLHPERR